MSTDAASGSPRQIVLVRHGETEWSLAGRHTGVTDLPLIEAGRQGAAALASALDGARFDIVLSSPRLRAIQTAQLAGFPHAVVEPDLAEWDYGAYEGRTTVEIQALRPGWELWRDGAPAGDTPGESPQAVRARVERVLRSIADRVPDGGSALVFAHGHILRAIGTTWAGQPIEDGANLALSPATISILGHERARPVIQQWNAPAVQGTIGS